MDVSVAHAAVLQKLLFLMEECELSVICCIHTKEWWQLRMQFVMVTAQALFFMDHQHAARYSGATYIWNIFHKQSVDAFFTACCCDFRHNKLHHEKHTL